MTLAIDQSMLLSMSGGYTMQCVFQQKSRHEAGFLQ
jgi:hypothetical protein